MSSQMAARWGTMFVLGMFAWALAACAVADAARCMKGVSANPDQTCTKEEK